MGLEIRTRGIVWKKDEKVNNELKELKD